MKNSIRSIGAIVLGVLGLLRGGLLLATTSSTDHTRPSIFRAAGAIFRHW